MYSIQWLYIQYIYETVTQYKTASCWSHQVLRMCWTSSIKGHHLHSPKVERKLLLATVQALKELGQVLITSLLEVSTSPNSLATFRSNDMSGWQCTLSQPFTPWYTRYAQSMIQCAQSVIYPICSVSMHHHSCHQPNSLLSVWRMMCCWNRPELLAAKWLIFLLKEQLFFFRDV